MTLNISFILCDIDTIIYYSNCDIGHTANSLVDTLSEQCTKRHIAIHIVLCVENCLVFITCIPSLSAFCHADMHITFVRHRPANCPILCKINLNLLKFDLFSTFKLELHVTTVTCNYNWDFSILPLVINFKFIFFDYLAFLELILSVFSVKVLQISSKDNSIVKPKYSWLINDIMNFLVYQLTVYQ